MKHSLIEAFNEQKRSVEVPFVVNDTAEVVAGPYAGRCGAVVDIDTSNPRPRFLVEFGDGTDELLPIDSLRLANE